MDLSAHNEDARFLELLHKWQSGDFTRAEEQELHALAKGDAFRQEALEGFLMLPEMDHKPVLERLRGKIRGEQPGKRVLSPQLWAIAAALVLLFGAIWFFNVRPVPVDNGQIAQDLPQPAVNQPEPEPPIAANAPESRSSQSVLSENKQPSLPGSSGAGASPAADKIVTPAASDAETIVMNDDLAKTSNVASAEEDQKDAYKRPGGIFDQSTNAAPPREQAESAARAKKEAESAKPSPVVASDKMADKAKAKQGSVNNQPAGGWDAFRTYLKTKGKLTPEALANNISGTVRIQFRLNDQNQPYEFKVLNGLGYGCDEAAIQLVKGYAWVRANDQPVVVDVQFVR
jgi:hypothetical protein